MHLVFSSDIKLVEEGISADRTSDEDAFVRKFVHRVVSKVIQDQDEANRIRQPSDSAPQQLNSSVLGEVISDGNESVGLAGAKSIETWGCDKELIEEDTVTSIDSTFEESSSPFDLEYDVVNNTTERNVALGKVLCVHIAKPFSILRHYISYSHSCSTKFVKKFWLNFYYCLSHWSVTLSILILDLIIT